jgi:hypothetical protein
MHVRDFRLWWGLFVFFAVLCVLVLQRGYRRWRRALALVAGARRPNPVELARLRREGWRLAGMALSLFAMTALVFAVLLGAPPLLQLVLRVAAVAGVLGVVGLSLRR